MIAVKDFKLKQNEVNLLEAHKRACVAFKEIKKAYEMLDEGYNTRVKTVLARVYFRKHGFLVTRLSSNFWRIYA